MSKPIDEQLVDAAAQGVSQGVSSGLSESIGSAFAVLGQEVWAVVFLLMLGTLVSSGLTQTLKRRLGTGRKANRAMGYSFALVWTAAIEGAYLKYGLGIVQWFPLAAAALTPAIIASIWHRLLYRLWRFAGTCALYLIAAGARKWFKVPEKKIEEFMDDMESDMTETVFKMKESVTPKTK